MSYISNETKLAVAKVCHEISGYLSVIKFMEDDFSSDENNELFSHINVMIDVMEFFRGVYSAGETKYNLFKYINNICKSKNVELNNFDIVFDKIWHGVVESVVGGIIYILMKLSRKRSVFSASISDRVIVINAKGVIISSDIFDALCFGDEVESSVSNVFAKYVCSLAKSINLNVVIDALRDNDLTIKIYQ